jgi:hypothetical protein
VWSSPGHEPRPAAGFFYDLVKANVGRIVLALAHELRGRPAHGSTAAPQLMR